MPAPLATREEIASVTADVARNNSLVIGLAAVVVSVNRWLARVEGLGSP